jgi:hypothetical protein
MPPAKKAVITLSDMPPGTVANISGNDFPQFKGLLSLAHQHGIESMHSDLVSFADNQAVIKAVAIGSRGTFEAYGDASPDNVPRGAHHEVIRRAETRAYSRALRLYTGIGECAADELSEDARRGRQNSPQATAQAETPRRKQPAPNRQQEAPQAPQEASGDIGSPSCPKCGSAVWDNRGTAQGKSPVWRCKNGRQCPGGRGDLGWASWEPDYFDTVARAKAIDDLDGAAQEQPPPPDPVDSGFVPDDQIPF